MRRILQNALLCLFGVVVALAIGEGIARLLWVDASLPERASEGVTGLPVVTRAREMIQPNLRAEHRGVVYETNRHGFRDRDYSAVPVPGVYRIAVIGDSVTMAQGVPGEAAYANVLEDLLNERGGSPVYEVLNLGLSGQSILQLYRRLQSVGLPRRPHLVVYGLTLNDIDGPHYQSTTLRFSYARHVVEYARFRDSPSYLLRVLWPRFHSLRELVDPPRWSYLYEVLHNYDESSAAWRDFLRGLDHFARFQENTGIPVVIFQHTALFYLNLFHPFAGVYEQIERAARERDLRVIQSFGGFRGEDVYSIWVAEHDFHPNQRGHAILAAELARGLSAFGIRPGHWPEIGRADRPEDSKGTGISRGRFRHP